MGVFEDTAAIAFSVVGPYFSSSLWQNNMYTDYHIIFY